MIKLNPKDKKGSEKYYILISLILGILLIGIIFSWIFQDYFFGNDTTSLVKCKESILVRNNLPDAHKFGINWVNFKDSFPLQCETQKITIKTNNATEAGKIIADAIAACWALYNQGAVSLFPQNHFYQDTRTSCFTCARIGFDSSVKNMEIDVKQMLLQKVPGKEVNYLQYLTANDQNRFLARGSAAFGPDFEIKNEGFSFFGQEAAIIEYPATISSDPAKGDLHITLSSWVISKELTTNNIFFYQNAQQNLKELTNTDTGTGEDNRILMTDWFDDQPDVNAACASWDGISV